MLTRQNRGYKCCKIRKAASLPVRNSTDSNMWLPLTVLVLAGAVAADYDHGWKHGNEYNYLVRSRTFTGMQDLSDQYTGILIKAHLTVQPTDSHTLRAKLSKAQYAHVHKELPGGWESEISDQMLELKDLPMSGKPFEIKTKHGVIRELVADKEVPTWEVNMLKSIVSQLQVDTQGENAKMTNGMQVPEEGENYGMFKAMEDSVGGKCEVHYDITPLSEQVLQKEPELAPLPELKGDGEHIDIVKTKDFSRCDQRMNYHFGLTGKNKWEPGSNDNGNFLSRSSTSRIVISGSLKSFTIQSSVTTSKMFVSPRFFDRHRGMVASKMNLTLVSMNENPSPISAPSNPESTGNLVYIFNNPFSETQQRKPGHASKSQSSKEKTQSDSPIDSNEQPHEHGDKKWEDSSSSISSSEEHDFLQPKPNLEEAPQNPLLPFFVGYKGKNIGRSDEVDPVKATQSLVLEIAYELEDPSDIPTQGTLEKFTILSSLIRIMNKKQIKEAEGAMHLSPNELKAQDKSQAKKQNAWAVFRDAVTQAGTGPALMTIKEWIEKNKIEGQEAADIVSRLPMNARTPTAEYVKTLFELARDPKVMKDETLSRAAILAVADLVRQSQISKSSIHNRYPVHAFGRLASKYDNAVVEEYIPTLAQELKKAIKDGDSPRIQTYILALGKIGHPKILSVFEPYLEGKEPVTTFQRMLMVGSLYYLTDLSPKIARSVLYKIYLNTMEAHEVRCMAVYLLVKTNPPLNMLQRMAEFTKYDTNKHVNSAVKSTIESIARLDSPDAEQLAKKAQAAEKLFNPDTQYAYQYSQGYVADAVLKERNLAYEIIINYIGSEDSIMPRTAYMGLNTRYGGLSSPTIMVGGMVSSVRALLEMNNYEEESKDAEKSPTEKIAEALNIKPEEPVKVEGNLLWESKFSSHFLPFDKNTIEKLPEKIMTCLESMKHTSYSNMNKLMSYDIALSFPTETGLPFVYTLTIPTLLKFSGKSQLHVDPDITVKAKTDVRAVFSKKIQGRVGFVAPFEHQHFITGVDMDFQVYAPVRFEVDALSPNKKLQVKAWQTKGDENARLMHYSVVPYTSKHDILNLRPIHTEKNTHKVRVGEPDSSSEVIPTQNLRAFRVEIESDKLPYVPSASSSLDNLFDRVIFPWAQDEGTYRKIDVFMNLEQEQKEPIIFSAAFESMQTEADSERSKDWSSEAKAVQVSSSEPDSQDRRKQYLQEAAKGIDAARARVLDLSLETPGQYRSRNALTVAWAGNTANDKARILLYWHFDVPSEDIKYEVCTGAQATSKPDSLMDYVKAINSEPELDINVDVQYGRSCSKDGEVSISAKGRQSRELKDKIRQSKQAKACEEEMKHGNKILRACQKATASAMALDRLDVSVDFDSDTTKVFANEAVDSLKNMGLTDVRVDATNPKNAGKKKIDVNMKFSSEFDKAAVTVHTSVMDVKFPNIELSELGMETQSILSTNDEIDVRALSDDEDSVSCVLDSTRAETFDDKAYPLRLGNCWHVLMTTYAPENPDNPEKKLRIHKENRVSILARETEDGKKDVKMILGETEVRLSPSESKPEVSVNGKNIECSWGKTHQEKMGREVAFEIFRRQDESIAIMSNTYDVDVVYDGKRIMIKASDKYRNAIRGLCGNFDGQSDNDFSSPQNCMLRKPEDFIASYAMIKNQCSGPSLENARKSHESECKRRSNRLSNVISDRESGRSNGKERNWGYHDHHQHQDKRCHTYRTKVEMAEDKICFSTRPIPACAPECSATETKTKNYQFHCMPKNAFALEMQRRVEKGANPDLSQKPASLTRSIDVPLSCGA